MEHSGVNYNYAPWQLFTISKSTVDSGISFTDEPAANKVLRAQAALTLTVKFIDSTPDLSFDLAAG
ncbi:MAG: hypothetical protein R3361_08620, partial [Aequorivita vladivostokensis]|nr:hypothetical protein [Aequorivita vladivostokensis]